MRHLLLALEEVGGPRHLHFNNRNNTYRKLSHTACLFAPLGNLSSFCT
jgi:hypothetical protein